MLKYRICIFVYLKCKVHLYLCESVGGHLYYGTVEFKMQIYICIALLEIGLVIYSFVSWAT
jgi:hypothetical protein